MGHPILYLLDFLKFVKKSFTLLAVLNLLFFRSENDLSVRLLAHHVNDVAGNKLINRKVKQILKHDSYMKSTSDSDIALIRLDEEVELGNTQDKPSPLCLPTESMKIISKCTRFLQNRCLLSAVKTAEDLVAPPFSNY